MKLQMVALRDNVANVWNAPNYVPHLGMAIRNFYDECKSTDPQSVIGKHPEDFELWHIGEYDDNHLAEARFFDEKQRVRLASGANARGT